MVLTPLLGEAASTSWPAWRRMAVVFEPIRPVPPMMTIFMVSPPLSTIEGSALADCVLRIGNTGGCRQPWTDFPHPRQRAFPKAVIRKINCGANACFAAHGVSFRHRLSLRDKVCAKESRRKADP